MTKANSTNLILLSDEDLYNALKDVEADHYTKQSKRQTLEMLQATYGISEPAAHGVIKLAKRLFHL